MQNFTHRTLLGDVSYVLDRRSSAWHYCFCWKGERFRATTKSSDLPTAKSVAVRAIEAAQNSQNSALQTPTEPKSKSLSDLFDVFLFQMFPNETDRNSLNGYYAQMKMKGRAWFNRLLKVPQTVYRGAPLASDAAKYPGDWSSFGGQLAGLTADCTSDEARDAMQAFVSEYKTLVSGVSVHNHTRAAHRFFAWLIRSRHVSFMVNPASCALLDMPVKQRVVKAPASPEALEALILGLRADALFPVLVLMCAGFRAKECTRAKWADLELPEPKTEEGKKRAVDVAGVAQVHGKGKRGRRIPLAPWHVKMLREFKARVNVLAPEQRVWPRSHCALFHKFKRCSKEAGFTLGAIRRFTAWKLWTSGLTTQETADIMGNSPATLERYYVQFGTTESSKAVQALDNPFSKNAKKAN